MDDLTEAELKFKMVEFNDHLLLWGWARHPVTGRTWVVKNQSGSFRGATELGDLSDLQRQLG